MAQRQNTLLPVMIVIIGFVWVANTATMTLNVSAALTKNTKKGWIGLVFMSEKLRTLDYKYHLTTPQIISQIH